jgi:hypothetical protein
MQTLHRIYTWMPVCSMTDSDDIVIAPIPDDEADVDLPRKMPGYLHDSITRAFQVLRAAPARFDSPGNMFASNGPKL